MKLLFNQRWPLLAILYNIHITLNNLASKNENLCAFREVDCCIVEHPQILPTSNAQTCALLAHMCVVWLKRSSFLVSTVLPEEEWRLLFSEILKFLIPGSGKSGPSTLPTSDLIKL